MKAMQRLSAIFLVALTTSACVTIHIYFPAAAAEEAARTIVRDVLEISDPPESAPGADTEPTSRGISPPAGLNLLAWTLHRMVPAAAAQTPDLRAETPTTDRLRASMRARHAALAPYYSSGAIGFGNDGLVAIRDLSQVPLRERSEVQRLVREENADRSALYREIARANDRPDWEQNIRETFSRVWVEEAPSGYWYQDNGGNWRQK
ncbi:YdbL family protein [Thioalkalivibrio sp.]|uniref:YdbL family protein n=1 Tax=Thioalkalivibrio sp. TaxID=2093813 RepID=UPI003976FDE0